MSFLLAFAGFAVLIVLHEFGHFAAAKAVGMRVERFSLFFPLPWRGRMRYLARRQVGETEYAVGPLPLGGFVRITGMNPDERLPDEVRTRAYTAQPVWKRVVVIAAGPAMNVLLAFLLLLGFYAAIGPSTASMRVGDVDPSLPAAGMIRPGDRLVSIDGTRGAPEKLSDAVAAHRCPVKPPPDRCRATEPATIVLLRDGERVRLRVTPVYDKAVGRMRIGFGYAPGPRERLPLGEALETTSIQLWFVTEETVKLPARFFDAERRKEISSVVGAYEVTRRTIVDSVANAVRILAVISLALAIVNLFPFLPLDGGHIFWAVVEKLRRRPVPYSVMERAGVVGFMVVILVFLVGLSNDIDRLSGGGFDVR